jgi:hypothetical protein
MAWPESMLQSGGMSIFGNAFYRQDGDGKLTEVSDEIGAENYWPWGLSVGDLNADGYADVFISASMNFPFRYGVNSVLLNNEGAYFVDSEYLLGVEPRREQRTAKPWFTLDPTGEDKQHALVERFHLKSPVEVWGALGTRSSAIFDLDNDGDLDIVTNEFNDGPMVLISNLAEQKPISYLKVALQGSLSNRDGLAAVVRVHVGTRVYTQVHDGQSGYLSQSSYPLYFGLDEALVIDKIEIIWPSGESQTIQGPIDVNRVLTITEVTTR